MRIYVSPSLETDGIVCGMAKAGRCSFRRFWKVTALPDGRTIGNFFLIAFPGKVGCVSADGTGHGSRTRGRELVTARTTEAERLHPRARFPNRDLRCDCDSRLPGFCLRCYDLKRGVDNTGIRPERRRYAVLRKAPSRIANVTRSAFVFSPNSFMIRYL